MKHLISIVISAVAAQHGALETCFTCVDKGEDSYFCNWGGYL
jgi:hypothetical protein